MELCFFLLLLLFFVSFGKGLLLAEQTLLVTEERKRPFDTVFDQRNSQNTAHTCGELASCF